MVNEMSKIMCNNGVINLTELIEEFANEYKWHLDSQNPQSVTIGDGINSGLCDIFAERVKVRFPQTKILYDEGIDHFVIRIGNKFYDAENPQGVTDRNSMIFGGKG